MWLPTPKTAPVLTLSGGFRSPTPFILLLFSEGYLLFGIIIFRVIKFIVFKGASKFCFYSFIATQTKIAFLKKFLSLIS